MTTSNYQSVCIIPESLHSVLDPYTQLHCLTTQSLRHINRDGIAFLEKLLQQLTILSAKSQSLVQPITTIAKLITTSDRIYVITVPTAESSEDATSSSPPLHYLIGYIRVGDKQLFLHDNNDKLTQITPLCCCDIFVHEQYQRQSLGRQLFDHMIQCERSNDQILSPANIAYDRPSNKLISFLRKHYGLERPKYQANNYVTYDAFFETKHSHDAGSPYSTPSHNHSDNTLTQRRDGNDSRVNHNYRRQTVADLSVRRGALNDSALMKSSLQSSPVHSSTSSLSSLDDYNSFPTSTATTHGAPTPTSATRRRESLTPIYLQFETKADKPIELNRKENFQQLMMSSPSSYHASSSSSPSSSASSTSRDTSGHADDVDVMSAVRMSSAYNSIASRQRQSVGGRRTLISELMSSSPFAILPPSLTSSTDIYQSSSQSYGQHTTTNQQAFPTIRRMEARRKSLLF